MGNFPQHSWPEVWPKVWPEVWPEVWPKVWPKVGLRFGPKFGPKLTHIMYDWSQVKIISVEAFLRRIFKN